MLKFDFKWWIGIAIILIGLYLFGCLYCYLNQERLIFMPSRDTAIPPTNLNIEEVGIKTPDDEILHAWWMKTEFATATVLFFHGNAGNLSDRSFRLNIFHDMGLNALILDYRGYGKSSGKIKNEGDLYIDSRAAYNFLVDQLHINEADIIIWGKSLGTGVAVELAQTADARALILESPYVSLVSLVQHYYPLLPVAFMLQYRIESGERIHAVESPVLVVHSTEDEIIPFYFGEELFKKANQPKAFLSIVGGHNNDIIMSYDVYRKGVLAFLKDYTR